MLSVRKAEQSDALLYYEWANEKAVRRQSFNSEKITLEEHVQWFEKKITDSTCIMLIFENKERQPVGQVRFQQENEEVYVVGISVDAAFRGKGLAPQILIMASEYFFSVHPLKKIHAFIKQDNMASVHSFEKAGYANPKLTEVNGIKSFIYTKENANANS